MLHVEDDSDDAFFVARAFGRALAGCVIRRVKDGREAMDFLGGTGEFSAAGGAPQADLVLLDLKLPDVGGFEVLQWIRSQARFKALPVVILSGSSVEEDKQRARELGASAYFVKTPNYADVAAFVAGLLPQKGSLSFGGGSEARPEGVIGSAANSQELA